MQLHNILITDNNRFPISRNSSQNNSVLSLDGDNISARLTDFLSSGQLSRGTSVNLVLDQTFIRYQYFSFPLISSRKIRNILQFELEDTLLKGTEEYVTNYNTQSNKKSGITETGVFIIEKLLLEELISIFKMFSLELRSVSSLENLMDLAYHESTGDLENNIVVELETSQRSARFFTYKSGFLTGISAIPLLQVADEADAALTDHQFVNLLNQKVNAIRLDEAEYHDVTISGGDENSIGLVDQQFSLNSAQTLSQKGNDQRKEKAGTEIRLDHPRRINLIKSNILILQELKKYSRSLYATAGILLVGLSFFVAAVAYRGYNDHIAIKALEKRLDNTISKYLPRGTSKTNALQIVKSRVEAIEQEKEKNRLFERRRYKISKTLTDISLLKSEVPSLTLSRFSMNEQVTRFQGNAASIQDFDRFREALLKLYPSDTFRVKSNEKTRGAGSVEFSTTIQRRQN